MNTRIAIISISSALLLASGVAYATLNGGDDKSDQQSVAVSDSSQAGSNSKVTTTSNPALRTAQAGNYVDYREGIIEETKGVKLVFFHAPWCQQCRMIEKGIEEQGVPGGVTIIKADFDTSNDLRKKYEVTLQTTFVKVDDQGNLIKKYVAYNEPSIESVRRELL